MRRIIAAAGRFARDTSGATAIEYALIAAGVAGAVILAVETLGQTTLTQLYEKVDDGVAGRTPD